MVFWGKGDIVIGFCYYCWFIGNGVVYDVKFVVCVGDKGEEFVKVINSVF